MAAQRRNARRRAPSVAERLSLASGVLRGLTRRLVTLTALLMLAGGSYLALDALRERPVERIVVLGKLENLRQEALREVLADELDGGLVFLDLAALRGHLEALPWVYRAQLRRRFPDTLEVRVVEQLPIARWGDHGFLNHEARLIEVLDDGRWEDLPRLRGPAGSEARLMGHYQKLLDRLRPLNLTPVALNEGAMGQLEARFDGGLVVNFGATDFALRLQRLSQLWTRELVAAATPATRVDLRYSQGAAVAFATPTEMVGMVSDSQSR